MVVTVLLSAAAGTKPFRADASRRPTSRRDRARRRSRPFNAVTGETFAYNGQVHFVTASTIRVAILGAASMTSSRAVVIAVAAGSPIKSIGAATAENAVRIAKRGMA